MDSFLSSFTLFSSEVWILLLPRRISPPPGEQSWPRPYLEAAHFPGGNLPVSTLGSALKWWTSETWTLFVCRLLISEAERCCCHLATMQYLQNWHLPLSLRRLPRPPAPVDPELKTSFKGSNEQRTPAFSSLVCVMKLVWSLDWALKKISSALLCLISHFHINKKKRAIFPL